MKNTLATFTAFICLTGAAYACPNWNNNPTYGAYDLSLSQLRAGQALELTAGGSINWNDCQHIRVGTDDGPGFFEAAPDVRFFVNNVEGRRLTISTNSACDSTLLINTQSASWFYDDDDNGNADAKIVLTRPLSGQIDVWVGTYDGQYCDARVSIQVN